MFLSTNGILSAFTTITPGALLLDDTALANHQIVLSVRRLKTSYTGFCMEVRRSSDNTTKNIGFVNDYLDTGELLSFVGAGSGFVRTWYDQSGNGRHYVQTTNSAQPRIVNAGTLDSQNGKAALVFSGAQGLASASDYTLTKDQSIFLLNTPAAIITSATAAQVLIDGGPITSGAENNTLIFYGSVTGNLANERLSYLLIAQRFAAPAGAQVYGYGQTSADIPASQQLQNFNYSGTTATIYQNAALQTLSTSSYSAFRTASPTRWPTIFRGLGFRSVNSTAYFNGRIQEYMVFNEDITSTGRTTVQTNVNGFYGIY